MAMQSLCWPDSLIRHIVIALLLSMAFIHGVVGGDCGQGREDEGDETVSREKILIRKLLDRYCRYGRTGRPVVHTNDMIDVRFALQLIQIINLDEKAQVLTTSVWFDQRWFDTLLTWDPVEYDNLTEIRLPADKIWIPDIVLYNFADTRLEERREALVVVKNTGETKWMPQAFLKSSCAIDITYFPFDSQNCSLKFGSWTYDGSKLGFDINGDNLFIMSDYMESHEWDILENTAIRNVVLYECCPDSPYYDITYRLIIKRRVAFYSFILVLPCTLLSLMTLVIFWVPPESPAKLMLGMNIFVAFFVLLLLLSESTPRASASIPLIGAYYCLNMVMITVSTLLACLVANMFFRGVRRNRAPKWLRSLMIDGMATLLFMRNQLVERDEDVAARKWNSRVSMDKRSSLGMSPRDVKFAKIRLLDAPNGREIGQKLSMAHEIVESRVMRCTSGGNVSGDSTPREPSLPPPPPPLSEERSFDPLRISMLEELKSIRELIEKARGQKSDRDQCDRTLREWKVIACITDRLFFIIFVIVNTIAVAIIFFST